MTYEAFCEYVKNHILDGMEEKEVMTAVIKDVKKNNNIVVKALIVAKNETDIFYNIYLEDYVNIFEKNRSLRKKCENKNFAFFRMSQGAPEQDLR